jgi:hypothetical protein
MYKKIAIALLLVWLPFLLINDFYPFFRFGMFAEPIRTNQKEELFILYYTNKKNIVYKFNTYQIGVDESVFNYLVRKYYYQNKMNDFEKKFRKSTQNLYSTNQDVKAWHLYRVQISNKKRDSSLIATYENK